MATMRFERAEPIMRDNLLRFARAYAEARGVKLVTISALAYGEAPFFDMLVEQDRIEAAATDGERPGRKGSFTMRKYDEVIAWFWENWPADVPMPKLKATEGTRDVQGRRSGAVRQRPRQRRAAAAG